MEIKVQRKWKKEEYTLSDMYIDGVWFCNTLEDTDRGLNQNMPLKEIKEKKVYGKTAIPTGRYKVVLSLSNRFKKTLPEILNVPGWEGVRIHSGNTVEDTLGCLLVGINKAKGKVLESKIYMEKLMNKLKGQKEIWLTIE